MNSELRKQFLYILQGKQSDRGFSLIELLIVMITLGILSAIAVPSVLSHANKAKQVEAKSHTSSMNRAQQVYYLENFSFTTSISSLGVGLKNQTKNYNYIINLSNDAFVTHNAVSRQSTLKSYAGITYLEALPSATANTTTSTLCESNTAQVGSAQTATSGNCPNEYADVKGL